MPDAPETTSSQQQVDDVRHVDGGPGCAEASCYLEQQLWEPVLRDECLFCHNAGGPAKASALVLAEPNSADVRRANFAAMCASALTYDDGVSRLLSKPSYQTDHGGGLRVAEGSDEYAALAAFVAQAEALSGCSCDGCDGR